MPYKLTESFEKNSWWFDSELPDELFTHHPEGFLPWIADTDSRKSEHRNKLRALAKGKVIIDLGCGAGWGGFTALAAGAKFCYFVDINPQTTMLITKALKMHPTLRKDQYQVITADIMMLTREQFHGPEPELVYSEFYGPLHFDEGFYEYTRHLDTLFPNLYYYPEHLSAQIEIWPNDFSKTPWPRDPELLHSYKAYYANKPWMNTPEFLGRDNLLHDHDIQNRVNVGTVFYNAVTKELCNTVIFESPANHLVGIKFTSIGHEDHFGAFRFGWWLEEAGTYEFFMDVEYSNKKPFVRKLL